MNFSNYSVKAYLVILLVFGIVDISLAAYLRVKSPRRAYARKMFLRGCVWVILSVCFLDIFRRGILGVWTVFITVGVLVIANEYLLLWIDKDVSTQEALPDASVQKEIWSVTRARGKRRFILISIGIYGLGLLWTAILIKIILPESFPFYLVALSMVGGGLWGYFEGAGEWKRNENQYLKLKDSGHDTA
jgi:hypothetical protein